MRWTVMSPTVHEATEAGTWASLADGVCMVRRFPCLSDTCGGCLETSGCVAVSGAAVTWNAGLMPGRRGREAPTAATAYAMGRGPQPYS